MIARSSGECCCLPERPLSFWCFGSQGYPFGGLLKKNRHNGLGPLQQKLLLGSKLFGICFSCQLVKRVSLPAGGGACQTLSQLAIPICALKSVQAWTLCIHKKVRSTFSQSHCMYSQQTCTGSCMPAPFQIQMPQLVCHGQSYKAWLPVLRLVFPALYFGPNATCLIFRFAVEELNLSCHKTDTYQYTKQ